MRCVVFITSLLLISMFSYGQSFEWWKTLVKWDGVTHWSQYIKYSPKYLGPNALPVPKISNGSIDSVNAVSISAAGHYMKGDGTINTVVYGNYCLVKNRISVDAFWVPVEWYQMSHELKEQRRVYFNAYNNKLSVGDVHLNVNVQFLNAIRHKVQLNLRVGYRYPTSTNRAAARMTDAPGYFFDLSAARNFSGNPNWKYMMMGGFLVWQLYGDQPQNDAFLFGAGIEFNKNQFQLQTNIAGYLGYFNNGDQPIVYRLKAGTAKKGLNGFLQFQLGLHDYKYISMETGLKYVFK